MATHPSIMRLRLKAISTIIQAIPVKPDTSYWLDSYEIQTNRAESALANRIRQELNNLPKGYSAIEPSLKSKAKERFLQWKRNQAQAAWKKLPASEQERWEAYVTEGAEFGTIREREIAREAPFEVGDRVVLHHNIRYLGETYPAGSAGKIIHVAFHEVKDEDVYQVWFDDEKLSILNTFAHEIRKA